MRIGRLHKGGDSGKPGSFSLLNADTSFVVQNRATGHLQVRKSLKSDYRVSFNVGHYQNDINHLLRRFQLHP